MNELAQAITAALSRLVGEPISDFWRVGTMGIFEFGPRRPMINRQGDEVETSDLRIHLQTRWRLVGAEGIVFGRDDVLRSADPDASRTDFDANKDDSALDVKQRAWFGEHRPRGLRVTRAEGDAYGGFRLELEGGFALECLPCDSDRGEHSEHWRMLGPALENDHFVVDGNGVQSQEEDDEYQYDDDSEE